MLNKIRVHLKTYHFFYIWKNTGVYILFQLIPIYEVFVGLIWHLNFFKSASSLVVFCLLVCFLMIVSELRLPLSWTFFCVNTWMPGWHNLHLLCLLGDSVIKPKSALNFNWNFFGGFHGMNSSYKTLRWPVCDYKLSREIFFSNLIQCQSLGRLNFLAMLSQWSVTL